jgi:hypothetical protein
MKYIITTIPQGTQEVKKMQSYNRIILLLCFGLALASLNVFGANQNVSNENVTINLSLLDQPRVTVLLEDGDSLIPNELDPTPNGTFRVNCSAIVTDGDGDGDLQAAWAYLYFAKNSTWDDADDPRDHYTNSSCIIDPATVDGDNEAEVDCNFDLQFYIYNGTWECNVTVNDSSAGLEGNNLSRSNVTELLAINVPNGNIDFGALPVGYDTGTTDFIKTVYNMGNINIGVKLNTWGLAAGDGDSMRCTAGSIDDSALRVDTVAAQTYADRTSLVSSAGDGTILAGFTIPRQTSGTLATNDDLYFGTGTATGGAGFPEGECDGNIMFTGYAL